MTTKELYTKDTKVWLEHPEKVWETATVSSDYRSGVLIVRVDDTGEIRQIQIKDEKLMPPLCNPLLLIGQNDLTSLSYLHEPAVLHNLRVRFCDRNAIYTYCGIVLVAINPYYELPIYGEETIMAYRGQAMGDLDPHIFAVAEEAYTKLEREGKNQSIIVSGESGAGKTVSAKYAMRYFAAVGGSGSETHVERRVLASSPIMEAIGNAKTTRNDNSSRFGKFIQIRFDPRQRISGAAMRTYLLEKSRVVQQSTMERNYHVFYQMCANRAATPELALDHQDTFKYLNQGGSPEIEGIDDFKTFQETKNALTTLGVTDREQTEIFTVLAFILHLGNVEIVAGDDDGAYINTNDVHLQHGARLLGIDPAETARWLTHRRIASGREVIVARSDVALAAACRDAVAKHVYEELFTWIVDKINRALGSNDPKAEATQFIGVLDIYGFETFEVNSFEQFCINYANEKLQQQFNSHVFKLEQDEYIKEGITWQMISFHDNQPCIDLIEDRLGVLALLDEECRVPRGSDRGFVAKLHAQCAKYPHYVRPRFGEEEAFIVVHFADRVEYQAGGFLEKNRDAVSEAALGCVRAGRCRLLQGARGAGTQPAQLKGQPHRSTVGHQFRASLSLLMATLSGTGPHYVRCIKPNDDKLQFRLDAARAQQQLRACGVLETIRISAAGFPSRWLYQDFFHRYRLLCLAKEVDRSDIKATCKRILTKHVKDNDKYQMGATKIFFRAGQVAYLEKLRAATARTYCVRVQSLVRRFACRRRYVRVRRAVLGLQARARGMLARRKAQAVRRERAATTLQRYVRGWLARASYRRLRSLAVALQARCRGVLARRRCVATRRARAALTIQRHWRGCLARRRAVRMQRHIVVAQSAIRRFLARRQYKRLRIEARSLDHVKTLNRGLENKIISLQQRLNETAERCRAIEPLQKTIGELKSKVETLKPLEGEVKHLKEGLSERDRLIVELQKELATERDKCARIAEEKKEIQHTYEKEKREWEGESDKLAKELISNKEHYDMEKEELEKRFVAETQALSADLEAERQSRQKLLSTQNDLQERLDSIMRTPKSHKRTASDVSNNSQQEGAVEDDFGYGSVRSVESSRPALEAVNWSASQGKPCADPGLVLRLQARASALQSELARSAQRANDLEERLMGRLATPPTNRNVDRFTAEELEIENKKLKEHLERVHASADRLLVSKEIIDQMGVMQKELDRRRDEIIQLKSVLTNQKPWFQALKNVTVNLKSLASNYGSDVDVINEDGELASAYETQKNINRQLQEELTAEKQFYSAHIADSRAELMRLREENDKYHKLLSTELSQESPSRSLEYAQNEISKLAAECLALQERVERLSASCRRYKGQTRLLAERLRQAGVTDVDNILDNNEGAPPPLPRELAAVARRKEREYLGMFEYRAHEEARLIKTLILDLKPATAQTLLPCLPSYILLMILRHMDHVDDEPKMHGFMKSLRNGVKKTLKRHDITEYKVLWLANMVRLLNNLRQYSGDAVYQGANSARQNSQCFRLFDLSEYRQLLSDLACMIYQGLVTLLEKKLESLIIPAILEHEEISGLTGAAGAAAPRATLGPARLKAELGAVMAQLGAFAVDPPLVLMLFKQLFYYICAYTLNQLLLRKDLCCWAKGLQIRYNISHLETWIKENLAEYGQKNVEETLAVLQPITQAVQLLQARKSMADVGSTVDMCSRLTAMQVCKILNLYTPSEEYEVRVTKEFIQEIQRRMQDKYGAGDKEPHLLMESTKIFSVSFPFQPSAIRLEDVELPEVLGLRDLLTKL